MRLNGYWRSRTFNGKMFEFRRAISRHRRRGAHSVIGCARSHPASTFRAGLMTSALPNALATDVQDRSPQRPHALAKGTAHPHARPRVRRRGTRRAVRGGEGDQARRNRIATRQARPLTKAPHVLERRSRHGSRRRRMSSGTRSPHEARGICPRRIMTRGRRIKARDVRG